MIVRHRRGSETMAGFTLLEALVATALMGLILAALATVTAQWLPNWDRGLVRVQRNEQIALALDRLSADLAAAQFIPLNGEAHKPFFDGTQNVVTFVRTALGPNTSPSLEFVRIGEVKSEQGPVLVRTRAPFVPVDRAQPAFTDAVVLLRPPYQLSFSYAGADRVWRQGWQDEIQLPKSIKLTVRDAATQEILPVSTAILIHADIPITCISAKSYAECLQSEQSPVANKSTFQQ